MRNFQGYFSRTFQDAKLQFRGLSMTKVIFQDIRGAGILKTFQEAWEPCLQYSGARTDTRTGKMHDAYIHAMWVSEGSYITEPAPRKPSHKP